MTQETLPGPLDVETSRDTTTAQPEAPTPRKHARSDLSVFGQIRRSPRALIALAWILLVFIMGAGAPWLAPHDPLVQDLANSRAMPSAEFWLGTDTLGRDVLSRIMYGGLATLGGVVTALTVALGIGLPAGVAAGYFGGWIEVTTSKVADALLSLPGIIIMLLAVAIFGSNLTPAMVALGVILSAQFYRLARGGARGVRGELFIDAAQVAGLHDIAIAFRHVVPNMIRPIIVQSSVSASTVILMQSGLSFLGLGPPPPSPQWGSLVAEAQSAIYEHPWLMVPSGLAITLTALAFNMFGDALTDSATPLTAKSSALHSPRVLATPEPHPETADDAPLLQVSGLSVAFPGRDGLTRVVQDVSFTVSRNEVVAVVGESGCGKTITALSVAGLLPGNAVIEQGSLIFEGREILAADRRTRARLHGRSIAYIPQEPMQALDPCFTVESLLREPLRNLKGLRGRAARERALELLEGVGIADAPTVLKRYPHQLSGGMAQRVCIAIALAGEPELLIADEPTTALDVTVQAEILQLLRSVQRHTGVGLILVTHNLGVVADIASRVVVMYAGEVVEHADVGPLFREPSHPYTRALLRSVPRPDDQGSRLATIPGTVPPPAEWPTGCHFANRCPFSTPECEAAPIPLVHLDAERSSRCIRIEHLREAAWTRS